jgi:hypothetical protein
VCGQPLSVFFKDREEKLATHLPLHSTITKRMTTLAGDWSSGRIYVGFRVGDTLASVNVGGISIHNDPWQVWA